MSLVAKVDFESYETSIPRALDLIGAGPVLPRDGLIIIKPNLTNDSPPPVTTHVDATRAVCSYCRAHTSAEIVIADGCGSGTTRETFDANGYTSLAEELGIRLIDLNEEDTVTLACKDAVQLKQFHMPRIVKDAYVVSVPVLKDHSFTETTIAMKNMFGIAPTPFYAGSWNKSKLHSPSTHQSVVDVCLYKMPDLSVVDASVALSGMHLAGTPRHLNKILAGHDAVAVDAVGSEMMGHIPAEIEYLTLADGLLGDMDNVEIVS